MSEHVCDPEDFEYFSVVKREDRVRCKKCGSETRYCEIELPESFAEIARKIDDRDSLYEGTWRKVPVEDLIAVARLKTFRATTMLNKSQKEKLLDDLIDAAAYLVFAIERVKEGDVE